MKAPIDLSRCRRGMQQLEITGSPRARLIEEAIQRIQSDPVAAMATEYLGIKNYAGFGDQREDHGYGYGPKHGTIVFRIGRTDAATKRALDADAVYLLECYRDFKPVNIVNPNQGAASHERVIALNLCGAIRRLDTLTADLRTITDAITEQSIEAHAEAVNV